MVKLSARRSEEEPIVRAAVILAAFSLACRAGAAALRPRGARPAAAAGWLLAGLGAWAAAAAAGAWAPVWVPVAAAALAALIFARNVARAAVRFDAACVVIAGAGAPLVPLAAAAGIYAVAGALIDRVPFLSRARLRVIVPLFFAVLAAGSAALDGPRRIAADVAANPSRLRRFGIAVLTDDTRIVFPSGAVAWLDRAPHPIGGALFFHGNHPEGSQQPAARVVRRALVAAGYTVLSLDREGFGDSPPVPGGAPLSAWNPAPADEAAYDRLRQEVGDRPIIAVGHSMGCTEVVRMMLGNRPLAGAVVMGAGFADASTPDRLAYWLARFNHTQRLNPPMTMKEWRTMEDTWYEARQMAPRIPAGRAPLLFIQFTNENADLKATRDRYWALLPEPKKRVVVHSTHYLDASRINSFLVGDPVPCAEIRRALGDLHGNWVRLAK
jgi:pimeloyl-ACP methyl ester carboxylesterase